jgi:protein-tyrosine-phosphatase
MNGEKAASGISAEFGPGPELADTEPVFTVYFVCTGNRCRSPVARALFESYTAGLPVEVRSAGLLDMPGAPSPRETIAAARGAGIDLERHGATSLSAVDLRSANLVVGFERHHVAGAVADGGARAEVAFNILELVDLLSQIPRPPAEGDPIARATGLIAAAHRHRLETHRFVPGEEVFDPIGLPVEAHVEMVTNLSALCRRLASGLFGDPAPSGGRPRSPMAGPGA